MVGAAAATSHLWSWPPSQVLGPPLRSLTVETIISPSVGVPVGSLEEVNLIHKLREKRVSLSFICSLLLFVCPLSLLCIKQSMSGCARLGGQAFEKSLPEITDEASFQLRKKMLEARELKEWEAREDDMRKEQELRYVSVWHPSNNKTPPLIVPVSLVALT